MMPYTLALGMPGLTEWIIIGALGLLIFGKRLPEVGRSLGKGIVEFKKGLKGIEEDVTQVDDDIDRGRTSRPVLSDERKNYKFDPETGKPLAAARFDPYTGKPIDADQPAHADEHPSPQTP
jgi:sec-independent protein translocase protein TatA